MLEICFNVYVYSRGHSVSSWCYTKQSASQDFSELLVRLIRHICSLCNSIQTTYESLATSNDEDFDILAFMKNASCPHQLRLYVISHMYCLLFCVLCFSPNQIFVSASLSLINFSSNIKMPPMKYNRVKLFS